MKNASTTIASHNKSSSSTLASSHLVEGIALCTAFMLEAVFIVGGNLVTIVLFAQKKKLRKKSLYLVINMAFADVMLGALSLPWYVHGAVGPTYQLWTYKVKIDWVFYRVLDTICSQASLISAVFISCERFYAIFWPLKHKTLSIRTCRIVILMTWILAIIVTMLTLLPLYLLSPSHASSLWMSFPLLFLFVMCVCNVAICIKFQLGNNVSQQQNRATKKSKKRRLTKTLLLVSAIAVLSWLPLVIANYLVFVKKINISHPNLFIFLINILNLSNSFFKSSHLCIKNP